MKAILSRVTLLLMGFLLLLPGRTTAPIFGVFTGFERLAERAPFIAIIRVTDDKGTYDPSGMHSPYEVEAMKMLKGTLPEWAQPEPPPMSPQGFTYDPTRRHTPQLASRPVTMLIRPLIMVQPRLQIFGGIDDSYHWLVFFELNERGNEPRFITLNVENAVIPLHPRAHLLALSTEPDEWIKEVIEESIRLSEEDARRLKNILGKDS